MTQTTPLVAPRHAVGAGMVAAAVAIAVGEAAHVFSSNAPSLVLAIGHSIVNGAPSALIHLAINSVGTADKPGLLIGIVVVAILLGSFAGKAAAKRFWVGPAAMATAGLLAVAAEADRPSGNPVGALVIAAIAVAAGSGALLWLLRVAADPPAENAGAVAGRDMSRRRFLVAASSLTALAALPLIVGRVAARGMRAAASRALVVLPKPVRASTAAVARDVIRRSTTDRDAEP